MFVMENSKKFTDAYRLGDVIGGGAFGEVRLCMNRQTGAKRAVKICRKDTFDSED